MSPNSQLVNFLLFKLAEESSELAEAAAKAGCYSLSEHKANQLIDELSDVIAVTRLLGIRPDEDRIDSKFRKLQLQAEVYAQTGSGDPSYNEKASAVEEAVKQLNSFYPASLGRKS